MKRFMTAFLAATALIAFSCIPAPGWAFEGYSGIPGQGQTGKIHLGKVKVLPALGVYGTWDDNIFLGNGDNNPREKKESDFITTITPQLMFEYDISDRGTLRFGGLAELAYYSDFTDNDWQNYYGLVDIDYMSPQGLFFDLYNLYGNLQDPFGDAAEYALGRQKKRWTNDLKTDLGYEIAGVNKVVGYFNYFKQEYDDQIDFTQNYDQYELGAGYRRRVMPKTWAFIRYHHGERDYDSDAPAIGATDSNDADYSLNRVNMGLKWEATGKLDGELNLGYIWIDNDNSTDIFGRSYQDPNDWIASTSITYTATDRTTLAFNLARDLRYTDSNSNQYFIDTGVGLNLEQQFMRKFLFRAGGRYSNGDYNDSRDDDNYFLNLGMDYTVLNWLKVGLNYSYSDKDSTSDNAFDDYGNANDFTDNRFSIFFEGSY